MSSHQPTTESNAARPLTDTVAEAPIIGVVVNMVALLFLLLSGAGFYGSGKTAHFLWELGYSPGELFSFVLLVPVALLLLFFGVKLVLCGTNLREPLSSGNYQKPQNLLKYVFVLNLFYLGNTQARPIAIGGVFLCFLAWAGIHFLVGLLSPDPH